MRPPLRLNAWRHIRNHKESAWNRASRLCGERRNSKMGKWMLRGLLTVAALALMGASSAPAKAQRDLPPAAAGHGAIRVGEHNAGIFDFEAVRTRRGVEGSFRFAEVNGDHR